MFNINKQSMEKVVDKHLNPLENKINDIKESLDSSLCNIRKLNPLVLEAQKYDDFEEFSFDYSINIMRGRYWHITNNPNFKIDLDYCPKDMSSMAGSNTIKGLMITSTPLHWKQIYTGKLRKYIAEIDLSKAIKNIDYNIVNRGFGQEIFVKNCNKINVLNTLPIKKGLSQAREYDKILPQSKEELKIVWEYAMSINKSHLTANDIFDTTTTRMSFYDTMLHKEYITGNRDPVEYFKTNKGLVFEIVYMSPQEYLEESYKIHRKFSSDYGIPQTPFETYLKTNIDPDLIDEYVEKTLEGSKMSMPVLDYDKLTQEGRHRAVVAMELGVEEIPVLVVRTYEGK